MSVVLDASAVLATIFGEPGGDRVFARLEGALMSVVNLAEVVAKHVDIEVESDGVARDLEGLGIRFAPMTVDDVELQATIRRLDIDASGGRPRLSLGDRACLALGMRTELPVITADRAWLDIGLPVEIDAIR